MEQMEDFLASRSYASISDNDVSFIDPTLMPSSTIHIAELDKELVRYSPYSSASSKWRTSRN